jgi:hypothetical protein
LVAFLTALKRKETITYRVALDLSSPRRAAGSKDLCRIREWLLSTELFSEGNLVTLNQPNAV